MNDLYLNWLAQRVECRLSNATGLSDDNARSFLHEVGRLFNVNDKWLPAAVGGDLRSCYLRATTGLCNPTLSEGVELHKHRNTKPLCSERLGDAKPARLGQQLFPAHQFPSSVSVVSPALLGLDSGYILGGGTTKTKEPSAVTFHGGVGQLLLHRNHTTTHSTKAQDHHHIWCVVVTPTLRLTRQAQG